MLDRKTDWKEPKFRHTRCLRSEIGFSIDLAPEKPGGERTPFEQALRTIFPGGWTRKDARWVAKQAIRAVSLAIIADGRAAFPLEAILILPDALKVTKLDRPGGKVIIVEFPRESAA